MPCTCTGSCTGNINIPRTVYHALTTWSEQRWQLLRAVPTTLSGNVRMVWNKIFVQRRPYISIQSSIKLPTSYMFTSRTWRSWCIHKQHTKLHSSAVLRCQDFGPSRAISGPGFATMLHRCNQYTWYSYSAAQFSTRECTFRNGTQMGKVYFILPSILRILRVFRYREYSQYRRMKFREYCTDAPSTCLGSKVKYFPRENTWGTSCTRSIRASRTAEYCEYYNPSTLEIVCFGYCLTRGISWFIQNCCGMLLCLEYVKVLCCGYCQVPACIRPTIAESIHAWSLEWEMEQITSGESNWIQ